MDTDVAGGQILTLSAPSGAGQEGLEHQARKQISEHDLPSGCMLIHTTDRDRSMFVCDTFRLNAQINAQCQLVNSMSVENLFSIAPLPGRSSTEAGCGS